MIRVLAMLVLLAASSPLAADDMLDTIYRAHAEAQGLDWRLVKAIAIVESNERADAVHAPSQSLGIMQVLCLDDGRGGCANRFDVVAWPPLHRGALFDPGYNVLIATQILAWNLRTYGLRRGVACYNAWSVCRLRQAEPFSNQAYLEKVLRAYSALKREIYP